MGHAFLRVSKFGHTDVGIGLRLSRTALICRVAFAATTVWAGILYFASWALGIAVAPYWLAAILTAIFLLVSLGLSMAAMGSDDS